MKTCSCKAGISNTGVGCTPLFDITKQLFIVPLRADDGTKNRLNLSSFAFDAEAFSDLINEADASKRFYPTPYLKNIEDNRADPEMWAASDGTKIPIRDGLREFKGVILLNDAPPKLVGKLNSIQCSQGVGYYPVDVEGNLIGILVEEDGVQYLEPIPMQSKTFNAKFVFKAANAPQMIMIMFTVDVSMDDEDLSMVKASEMEADALSFEGLKDVTATFTTPTTTGVIVALKTAFGTPLTPVMAEGLVAADFAFTNITDSNSSIGIVGSGGSFEETSPGVYAIEYDTADQPTVADVIKLVVTKAGFDFSLVTANHFTTA